MARDADGQGYRRAALAADAAGGEAGGANGAKDGAARGCETAPEGRYLLKIKRMAPRKQKEDRTFGIAVLNLRKSWRYLRVSTAYLSAYLEMARPLRLYTLLLWREYCL